MCKFNNVQMVNVQIYQCADVRMEYINTKATTRSNGFCIYVFVFHSHISKSAHLHISDPHIH